MCRLPLALLALLVAHANAKACPAFTCVIPPRNTTAATSVHRLRPSDIKVVGAMGDSLTAAFGAKKTTLAGEFGIPTEYRGVSWSIGGDGSYTDTCTLPNILKAFNGTAGERLAGAATGSDLLQCVVDPEGNCGLDTAISGSTSYSLTGQAKTLVANLKRLKDVDVAKDWKMVTIFIGGNDLCAVCTDATTYSAAKYSDNLEAALDVLQANLPRTFVSVVGVVDVGLAAVLSDNLPRTLMCPCMKKGSAGLGSFAKAYREGAKTVAAMSKYHTSDDFTVVEQPYYDNFTFPTKTDGSPDASFFAPDHFHYNQKGHCEAAVALWNNLLEPVGAKRTWSINMTATIVCPTAARPYFSTAANSAV